MKLEKIRRGKIIAGIVPGKLVSVVAVDDRAGAQCASPWTLYNPDPRGAVSGPRVFRTNGGLLEVATVAWPPPTMRFAAPTWLSARLAVVEVGPATHSAMRGQLDQDEWGGLGRRCQRVVQALYA